MGLLASAPATGTMVQRRNLGTKGNVMLMPPGPQRSSLTGTRQ
jgi:hypothetical protein